MARRIDIVDGKKVDLGPVPVKPGQKPVRRGRSYATYHDFARACRLVERGDNRLVLQYLFDDHPITEDDRLCLADYFEGKFKLKQGQHKTPRMGDAERAVRMAAAVAKNYILFLRKQGLSNRDRVKEKGIQTALAYMEFEGIPVREESLRIFMSRSKKKKRTKSPI